MKVHENICVFYKKQPTYNPQKTEGDKPVNSRGSRGKGNREEYDALWTSVVRNESEKTTMKYPRTVVEFNSISRGLNVHPTQKPIELMEYLIKTYTNEGETVLDNCMGSGTTGVAAKKTGRNFVGIEQDEKYFNLAVKRIFDA